MRFAVWMVVTALTVLVLICSSNALMVGPEAFYPDSSLRRLDTVPPGKPVLSLMKIWRGYGDTQLPGGTVVSSEDAEMGSITFTMGFPDAESRPRGRFGYYFHLADGRLPAGLEFSPDAFSTAMRGDTAYPYISWVDGRFWGQDAFSFRVYVTAIDSAGNESLPSNIVAVSDDGNQEERQTVAYEQYYLGSSSDEQREARWTGTDDMGALVSLTSSWSGSYIKLDTGAGIVEGAVQMQVGAGPGKPHRISFYIGPSNKQLGIYEMHGDSLRLCLAPPGALRPSTFHQDGDTRLYRLRKSAR